MRKVSIFQMVFNNVVIAVTAMMIAFIPSAVYAQQGGLENARRVLNTFREQLILIIPVAAAVILLCLAIGYAGRYIEKDTFVRWAIGVVIAGSAVEIANLLFKNN
ncbi:VirB2 family type IV secretion system major pilin TrwL [Bartonella phoceensis]|uniref:VirB2 family type IV secretion system major pilin TrwL n=1 Tax=Bartonella phoceensis TaxID=270249 RepID=UPI001ABBAD2E|nr:VirB2 family type IV secretion system major pilin TrwL [Bartonella phoceensis]